MALSQFARLRKAATQSATRLQKAGLSAPNFAKKSQLKSQAAINNAIQEMKNFLNSAQHTVEGARAASAIQDLGRKAAQSRQRNRDRAKPLLDYMQSKKYQDRYINKAAAKWNLSRHEQDLLRSIRFKHGLKSAQIKNSEIKQFMDYADFRFSIKNERGYYMDDFVKQFNNMKKSGRDWKQIRADFEQFRVDQRANVAGDLLQNKKYSKQVDSALWDRYVSQNYDY